MYVSLLHSSQSFEACACLFLCTFWAASIAPLVSAQHYLHVCQRLCSGT